MKIDNNIQQGACPRSQQVSSIVSSNQLVNNIALISINQGRFLDFGLGLVRVESTYVAVETTKLLEAVEVVNIVLCQSVRVSVVMTEDSQEFGVSCHHTSEHQNL